MLQTSGYPIYFCGANPTYIVYFITFSLKMLAFPEPLKRFLLFQAFFLLNEQEKRQPKLSWLSDAERGT